MVGHSLVGHNMLELSMDEVDMFYISSSHNCHIKGWMEKFDTILEVA